MKNYDERLRALLETADTVQLFSDLTPAEKEENRMIVEIANAMRKYRTEKNLNQSQLAKMLNVTQPMISQWENGDCSFTVESIAKIFDALKVQVDLVFHEKIETSTIYDNESSSGSIIDLIDLMEAA